MKERVGHGRAAATGLLLGVLAGGCGGPVPLELTLVAAEWPDPFDGVASVRVRYRFEGQEVVLDPVRWDQGPRVLPERLPIELDRVGVEGLSEDGRILASATSPPLDLIDRPVEALGLTFARVGVVSLLDRRSLPARTGWRAARLGGQGVLLLGGLDARGDPAETTWLIGSDGAVVPGPELPGGRAGAAVVSVGARVVVWGGRSARGPAEGWLALGPGAEVRAGPGPFAPGTDPVALPAGNRRVIVIRPDTAEVGEIDLVAGTSRPVGALDVAAEGAAFAPRAPGQTWVVGGRGSESAAVFDSRSARLLGNPVPLLHPRVGAAAVGVASGSAVVIGGEDGGHVVSLRFDGGTRTGTAASIGRGPALAETEAWDAGGGMVVAVDRRGQVARVELFAARSVRLDGVGGRFWMAPHPDGMLRGVAEDGRLLGFTAGPGPWVPRIASPQAGVIPDRPGVWRPDGSGVVGELRPGAPPSVLVLGEEAPRAFTVEVDVMPIGRGRASLWLDVGGGGYDRVLLQRSATLRASADRLRRTCPVADVPALDEGRGAVRVRLSREDRGPGPPWVVLDVGADGAPELECAFPVTGPGRVGLGVERGAVRFEGLDFRPEG